MSYRTPLISRTVLVVGILALAILTACGRDRAFLTIQLDGLSPEIKTVEVAAAVSGQRAVHTFSGDSTIVSMWLPPGVRGPMQLTVSGLDPSCAIAEATGEVDVAEQPKFDIGLTLSPLNLKKCSLRVTKQGNGSGTITADSGSLSCGTLCEARYPVGSTVRLKTLIKPRSQFIGFSSNCSTDTENPLTECQIKIDGLSEVSANFADIPCDMDGWCQENPLPSLPMFNAVWQSSINDVWVVGQGGLILNRTPEGWRSIYSTVSADLYSVAGTNANDVWVVGGNGSILHWDGKTITKTDPPTDRASESFAHVWALSSSEVWATSFDYRTAPLNWDGISWKSFTSSGLTQLFSSWGLANEFLISGIDASSQGKTFSCRANNCIQIWDTGCDERLWGLSDNFIWCPARRGATLSFYTNNAADFSDSLLKDDPGVPAASIYVFTSIWGAGPTSVFLASNFGTIFFYNGTWKISKSAPKQATAGLWSINGIWGSGPNNVYAVGNQGRLLHYEK